MILILMWVTVVKTKMRAIVKMKVVVMVTKGENGLSLNESDVYPWQ